jgi:uncharacterized membrane protein
MICEGNKMMKQGDYVLAAVLFLISYAYTSTYGHFSSIAYTLAYSAVYTVLLYFVIAIVLKRIADRFEPEKPAPEDRKDENLQK